MVDSLQNTFTTNKKGQEKKKEKKTRSKQNEENRLNDSHMKIEMDIPNKNS